MRYQPAIQPITPDRVTPALRALFRTDDPQAARCFAILDGVAHSGRILCDAPDHPTWAVVQEVYDNSIFLGGAITAPLLAEVMDTLRQEGDVLVSLHLDDPRQSLLPPDPDYDGCALEFYDRPLGQGLERYTQAVPAGCEVRRLDRALVMRTEWGPNDVRFVGGIDAWERLCLGYCLMQDGEILCEATAGPQALGMHELGVLTQAAHRGKGYATITVAHLIQAIEALGRQTYWICAKQNEPSAAIARKMGYRIEQEHRCRMWRQTAHAPS